MLKFDDKNLLLSFFDFYPEFILMISVSMQEDDDYFSSFPGKGLYCPLKMKEEDKEERIHISISFSNLQELIFYNEFQI